MTAETAMAAGAMTGYEPQEAATRASRSVARQAVIDTLASKGARFGLAWIAFLVLASVLAPFIATSYPLLAKEGGRWWSPALKQLTPAYVNWLVAFIAVAGLWMSRRVRFGLGFATLLWFVALT